MDELTAYFITTDRVDAAEALKSLQRQGIPRPVEVVRNVRPLRAAHLPTLECQTPYCLVLDDDTVMRPGVLRALVDRFRALRAADPSGFKLNARVFSEAKLAWDMGGLKLFYAPHLLKVGWPDAPHVSGAQAAIARRLGLSVLQCDIEAGVQRRGSDLDVYKKFLWIAIRGRARRLKAPGPAELAPRARAGAPWLWFGVLGLVDGDAVGVVSTSKDEHFLGPIGRTLDFDAVGAEDIRRILEDHGVVEAAGASPTGG